MKIDLYNFWSKVKKGNPDECWNWTACKNDQGYGKFGYKGKTYKAHRIVFFLFNGKFPNNFCCHSCDNPSCCNPNHLFDGTRKENQEDMSRKGRSPRGEKQGRSKLTEKEVLQIRYWLKIGMPGTDIAFLKKVTPATICNIGKRKIWNHI